MSLQASLPLADMSSTLGLLRAGKTSVAAEMERCIAAAKSDRCEHVFLQTSFEEARTATGDPALQQSPLGGLAVSVKDLFDVQGQVTRAGSLVLQDQPAAERDCPAVERLKASGGVLVGRTNMVEFAFSGVGINPHFGTPANAADGQEKRIPGGSSSGAGVAVAAGACFVGLGSDTGGSIRIPAALNGCVGFKSTARLVPAAGSVPLSSTLDTVGALTRSVADAILVHEILADRKIARTNAPLRSHRLAVARPVMQDGLDATVARAFERSLQQLRTQGASIEEIAFPEIDELPAINATGGFSAAESYAWHRHLLERHAQQYDPRVMHRIVRGASMRAFEYLDLQKARRDWIGRVQQRLKGFDAVLSPTVPLVAPLLAPLAPGGERDEAFFAVNGQLLRNTNIVNMLDGCAISIPCQAGGELPVGLMLWHLAMHDDSVLNLALLVEHQLGNAQDS